MILFLKLFVRSYNSITVSNSKFMLQNAQFSRNFMTTTSISMYERERDRQRETERERERERQREATDVRLICKRNLPYLLSLKSRLELIDVVPT